jgi:hypothetical protein
VIKLKIIIGSIWLIFSGSTYSQASSPADKICLDFWADVATNRPNESASRMYLPAVSHLKKALILLAVDPNLPNYIREHNLKKYVGDLKTTTHLESLSSEQFARQLTSSFWIGWNKAIDYKIDRVELVGVSVKGSKAVCLTRHFVTVNTTYSFNKLEILNLVSNDNSWFVLPDTNGFQEKYLTQSHPIEIDNLNRPKN